MNPRLLFMRLVSSLRTFSLFSCFVIKFDVKSNLSSQRGILILSQYLISDQKYIAQPIDIYRTSLFMRSFCISIHVCSGTKILLIPPNSWLVMWISYGYQDQRSSMLEYFVVSRSTSFLFFREHELIIYLCMIQIDVSWACTRAFPVLYCNWSHQYGYRILFFSHFYHLRASFVLIW